MVNTPAPALVFCDRERSFVDLSANGVSELMFAVGVLKNTSNLAENQKWLVQQGAVARLVAVLQGGLVAAYEARRRRRTSGDSGSDKDGGSGSDAPKYALLCRKTRDAVAAPPHNSAVRMTLVYSESARARPLSSWCKQQAACATCASLANT